MQRGDELFKAAGAGIAAVGIVTEVEFECEEAFGLEVTMTRTRLEDYLDEDDSGEKLWELARSREYVKVRGNFLTSPRPCADPLPSAVVLSEPDANVHRAEHGPLARLSLSATSCPEGQSRNPPVLPAHAHGSRHRLLHHDLPLPRPPALAERPRVLVSRRDAPQDAEAEELRGAVHGLRLLA